MITTIAGGTLVTGLVVGGLLANTGQASAPIQDPVVAQKLSEHDQELANHEARITNTENNVSDLQASTNTPASSRNTPVPAVPQTNTEVTAPPQPAVPAVTVTDYKLDDPEPNGNQTCHLTYSDGSAHSFLHVQKVNNVVATSGVCDDSLIGKVKADNFVGYN